MKKNILFLLNGRVSYLPPFQALLDAILSMGGYHLIVYSSENEPEIDALYDGKDIEFHHYYSLEPHRGFWPRVCNKIKTNFYFKFLIRKDLSKICYDILWVIHEKTAVNISGLLESKKYILTSYELRDKNPKFQKKFYHICNKAFINVACEYNRGWIMKSWYDLDSIPYIMPNKPFNHPRKKNIHSDYVNNINEKIILYQGNIERERNLDALCSAVGKLQGYKLILMGGSSDSYIEELKNKYPNILHIGYIKSPFHLSVTSNAYIGIVTYTPNSLNCIYCAPNKIWEYAGFGIPMLANDIPGLRDTVQNSHSGLCVDMDNVDIILDSIKEIENNYKDYSKNAVKMFDDCDNTSTIMEILSQFN